MNNTILRVSHPAPGITIHVIAPQQTDSEWVYIAFEGDISPQYCLKVESDFKATMARADLIVMGMVKAIQWMVKHAE